MPPIALNTAPGTVLSLPHELRTARLRLVRPTLGDCEEIFQRYASDAAVTRYLSWRPHVCVDDTRAFRAQSEAAERDGRAWSWLIRSVEDARLLGSIVSRIQGETATLGYCLARDAWGQGIASEAAQTVLETLKSESRIRRIESYCHPENRASARVLAKIGLREEGLRTRVMVLPNLSDEPSDMLCFGWNRCS